MDELYHVGQLVEGVVSRVAQFGAFVSLDPGIEALLHTSQISEPPPEDPTLVVHEGQRLLLRVISIETEKQRLGLSLKDVTEGQKAEWLATKAEAAEAAAEAAEVVEVVEVVEVTEVVEVDAEGDIEMATVMVAIPAAVPEDDNTL